MISPALSESSSVCPALVKARMYDSVENVVGENIAMVVIVGASGGSGSFQTNDPTNTDICLFPKYVLRASGYSCGKIF